MILKARVLDKNGKVEDAIRVLEKPAANSQDADAYFYLGVFFEKNK